MREIIFMGYLMQCEDDRDVHLAVIASLHNAAEGRSECAKSSDDPFGNILAQKFTCLRYSSKQFGRSAKLLNGDQLV